MKYRTKSADVLNEADRYQRILDWQLFCMEQETQLWGYSKEIQWTPGEPLYTHPNKLRFMLQVGMPSWWYEEDGPAGNHIRPMIQTIDFIDDTYEAVSWPDGPCSTELVRHYDWMRCSDCNVSWAGDEACWICGKSYPLPKFDFPSPFRRMGDLSDEFIGQVIDVEETQQGLFVNMRLERTALEAWRDLWRRQSREYIEAFNEGAQHASEQMRGLSTSFVLYDEGDVSERMINLFWGGNSPQPHVPVEYWDPSRTECTIYHANPPEIELVRPVFADINVPYSGARVDMPEDFDLDCGLDISRFGPRIPEPRDFSDWEYRPRLAPPTTPFRRNR